MKNSIARKVVIIVSVFSLLSGLFGCSGGEKYSADDIVLINTAYYGTERDPVYSFALRKENGNWFFSASCRVGNKGDHYTSFGSFPIPADEADKFLDIVREEGEVERLLKYRNPIRIFHIPDAPMCSSGMLFADGSGINKDTAIGNKALDYLYTLADRHYKLAESEEITAVFVSCSSMNHSSSYSFSLEKNGNTWYFSFDAAIDRSSGTSINEEEKPIQADDAEEILNIVKTQQLITEVKQYEKPADDGIFVLDETTYRTGLEFADGSSVSAPIDSGTMLTEAFYRLAEKYGQ